MLAATYQSATSGRWGVTSAAAGKSDQTMRHAASEAGGYHIEPPMGWPGGRHRGSMII